MILPAVPMNHRKQRQAMPETKISPSRRYSIGRTLKGFAAMPRIFTGLLNSGLALAVPFLIGVLLALCTSPAAVSCADTHRQDITVVLTWSGDSDLDLHVTGPGTDGERFRVYFGNRSERDCELLNDAVTGNSFELARIRNPRGPYLVYVHHYSSRESCLSDILSSSGARVYVIVRRSSRTGIRRPRGSLWYPLERMRRR